MILKTAPSFTPASNHSREQFAIISLSALMALGESGTRSEILTYTALAAHVDPVGHCWPGRERLAKLTGLDVFQISKATRGLEAKGLIRKKRLAGGRVDYYLLTPGVGIDTPAVLKSTPITDQLIDQKPLERAAPVAPAQAPLSPELLRTVKTPPPDGVPASWIDEAATIRPDLSPDQVTASAVKFLDYSRSKGTVLADWLPAFRNWIRRERPPRAPQGTQPHTRYQPLPQTPITPPISPEERAQREEVYKERMRRADIEGERRRLELLAARGIPTGVERPRPAAWSALKDRLAKPATGTSYPQNHGRGSLEPATPK